MPRSKVAPAELEALLRMHPDIEEAAVIGIPHAKYGEVPKAFVIVKKNKNPTEDSIKNFVKGKVSDYKELEGIISFLTVIIASRIFFQLSHNAAKRRAIEESIREKLL